jgi:hypothetical protein
VEIRKSEENGATVAPATNQEDTKAAPGGTGIRHVVCDFHFATPYGLGNLVSLLRSNGPRSRAEEAAEVCFGVVWMSVVVFWMRLKNGHQEVGIALVDRDVRLGRSVGGEAKRRAYDMRHGLSLSLSLGFPNGYGWRSERNELNLAIHVNSLYSWRHVPTEPIETPLTPLVCFLIGRSLAGKQFPSVVDLTLKRNNLPAH